MLVEQEKYRWTGHRFSRCVDVFRTVPRPQDPLYAEGLLRVVLETDSAFQVVGEAGDGLAAVELAARLEPDVILLDLSMPTMDGLEALPKLREVAPGCAIAVLSGFEGSRIAESTSALALKYSAPSQTSLDSNTVDMDRERASFVDNSVKYEATLRFINTQVRTMLDAMKSPSQG